jgi:hypothetical protein
VIFLFILVTKVFPKRNITLPIINVQNIPKLLYNTKVLSGISSNTLIEIITLKLKLKQKHMNLSLSLNLRKTTSPPKNVLTPANKETSKEKKTLLLIVYTTLLQ